MNLQPDIVLETLELSTITIERPTPPRVGDWLTVSLPQGYIVKAKIKSVSSHSFDEGKYYVSLRIP